MTDHAADYKPTSMVSAMFGDYIRYSPWLLLFAVYLLFGVFFFRFLGRRFHFRLFYFRLLYALGLLAVLRFCYGRGMFGLDYSDYFSMYKWLTVYLLTALLLCAWVLLNGKKFGREVRSWAVFLPVIILVTPLGSNNGLYPIINNLFLVMPVSVVLFCNVSAASGKCRAADTAGSAFRLVLSFVLVCTVVQSVLFGIGFVFHDAGAATARAADSRIELQCGGAGTGLVTTPDRKAALEELDRYLYQNDLNEKQVILYGKIAALAYLFDMEPAISTTWADLDSYGMDVLEQELERVSGAAPEALPVVIFGRAEVERIADHDSLERQKLELVLDFMEANGYRRCFENDAYIVLAVY